jgi:NADH-quinone oxidoreductase subunit E
VLGDDERREIAAALQHYADPQSAVITVLKIVQRHRRWIADDALTDIGDLLGLSPDEVDSRATFYNLIFRQPVGRHVILVCDSFACFVMGYEEMRRHLEERLGIGLGQTTADGRFTLLPVCCLGACDRAPAMMIDEDFHGPLDAPGLDRVLEAYP